MRPQPLAQAPQAGRVEADDHDAALRAPARARPRAACGAGRAPAPACAAAPPGRGSGWRTARRRSRNAAPPRAARRCCMRHRRRRRRGAAARAIDVAGQPAVRHAVGAQGVESRAGRAAARESRRRRPTPRRAALLPVQQVAAGRGLQPGSQLYNRASCHELVALPAITDHSVWMLAGRQRRRRWTRRAAALEHLDVSARCVAAF